MDLQEHSCLGSALRADGFEVSYTKVGQLLKSSGFSLQSNRKTREGRQHPDRDGQFAISPAGQGPATSWRTSILRGYEEEGSAGKPQKPGTTYRPKGKPSKSMCTISPTPSSARPFPTASMTCRETRRGFRWASPRHGGVRGRFDWTMVEAAGKGNDTEARRLLITGDSGGSNGYRNRLWKLNFRGLPIGRA